MSVQPAWDLLVQRERHRVAYSATKRPKTSAEKFYSVVESASNRECNRYSNILAYDRTAVTVNEDYLNANVVKDGYGRWWIASQAPLPNTFETFFDAIHHKAASKHPLIQAETDGAIIIQLTGDREAGARKADPYLNGWPDFGVPKGDGVEALRRLVLEIGEVGKGKEVWVHCSAGVGRSGAFIALSSLMLPRGTHGGQTSPLGPLPAPFTDDKVAQTIDGMREWRGALVQTMEQLDLTKLYLLHQNLIFNSTFLAHGSRSVLHLRAKFVLPPSASHHSPIMPAFNTKQYLTHATYHQCLLFASFVFLPRSSKVGTQRTSADRPEHPFLTPITYSPIRTMAWYLIGAGVCAMLWGQHLRTWSEGGVRIKDRDERVKRTATGVRLKIQRLKDAGIATLISIPCLFVLLYILGAPWK
ncbi:protein-tyrosine phosphatase-like protein [Dioszegia hungarica]|uniref:Protein-tyrosine phosphatase-like protein n=1 Tax=Dioszegia hungarica TaxID=4972 RepID=A0AA38LWT4_9TREE|nr:protein-tyrosine phosphatase-like protein [Dioszegia hungarica]KAI9637124.1 protein-tyrosine phosphatase-like protein [Dioszegia hungarica]